MDVPSPTVSPTNSARLGFVARAVDSIRKHRALRAARRAADEELLLLPVPSLRLAWRTAELVIPKNRLELARSLRELVRDADSSRLPGASPVNRPAVRAVTGDLLQLADRLADLERPVAPRGVLLVERLLTDGAGPTYSREPTADSLSDDVAEAARALELP